MIDKNQKMHKNKTSPNESCKMLLNQSKSNQRVMYHVKNYTLFRNYLQAVKKVKIMLKSFAYYDKTYIMNTNFNVYDRISCENYRFARFSENHRTTIAHFFNHGKWNDGKILKSQVIKVIYDEDKRSGKPIFCIVDDTIASKTKPSSRALSPVENATFHYSHLKNMQDYGNQAISVLLSYNRITFNYTVLLCDKSK